MEVRRNLAGACCSNEQSGYVQVEEAQGHERSPRDRLSCPHRSLARHFQVREPSIGG